MDLITAIGFIASILGILSFFGIGIPVLSLFKKNLFLSAPAHPYELPEGALPFKKN